MRKLWSKSCYSQRFQRLMPVHSKLFKMFNQTELTRNMRITVLPNHACATLKLDNGPHIRIHQYINQNPGYSHDTMARNATIQYTKAYSFTIHNKWKGKPTTRGSIGAIPSQLRWSVFPSIPDFNVIIFTEAMRLYVEIGEVKRHDFPFRHLNIPYASLLVWVLVWKVGWSYGTESTVKVTSTACG